jgi:hypothetical protein
MCSFVVGILLKGTNLIILPMKHELHLLSLSTSIPPRKHTRPTSLSTSFVPPEARASLLLESGSGPFQNRVLFLSRNMYFEV